MMMHTPPANQGQIVEVSYGWLDAALYMRVHDRSDRSTEWYRATDEAAADVGDDLWNTEPDVGDDDWIACAAPRDDDAEA